MGGVSCVGSGPSPISWVRVRCRQASVQASGGAEELSGGMAVGKCHRKQSPGPFTVKGARVPQRRDISPERDMETGFVRNSGGKSRAEGQECSRERFILVDDLALEQLGEPTWLIEGVIPDGSFAEIHGKPGHGKSFLALDWALSIATGQAWAGREVRQGEVVYVAGEGVPGYTARVRAWKAARGWEGRLAGVQFVAEPVQLHVEDDVSDFLRRLQQSEAKPVLIVFDTLARCFVGGDENSARAMGMVVAAVDRIREETGAAVLLVHHTTASGRDERGSSALRGAADIMASVHLRKDVLTVECSKMKDGAEFDSIVFQLVEFDRSCILSHMSSKDPLERNRSVKLPDKHRACLEVLPAEGASHGEWRRLAKTAEVTERTFNRAIERLVEAGMVRRDDGVYRRAA